ncbi:hypothetical protein [Cumulibacter soli]|uniref:hypothetical protein n=1 Tax=Cumulibacter soli TaxID=2546344 RepID=UPI001067825D|nr:hypothetical protein [Cumulibacter soli]
MTTKTKDSTGLDRLDPATHPARDAKHFRAIIAANDNVETARRELADAVSAARDAGNSWTVIGAALGISRQAAQERFSKSARR